MRQLSFWKITAIFIFVLTLSVVGPRDAFSEFDVDWGVSYDDAQPGYTGIAAWLVDNGYYGDTTAATTYAQTGYIGYNNSDADPYYWDHALPVTDFQIVKEVAGYADLNVLGYYVGSGNSKTMTQIFGGTDSGPVMLSISEPFGLYLGTPEGNTWYTDRTENTQQGYTPLNLDGDAQALIYELEPDYKWLVAWEDLDATDDVSPKYVASDRDYNDMYVTVTATPEPVSTVLFLVGGAPMVAAIYRKRRKNNK